MSKPPKPVRQDYIAKVRYINHLPPPPLNPKFLRYNSTQPLSAQAENEALLSSLFRKDNFNAYIAQVDEEYGMGLNPLLAPGFLDAPAAAALAAHTPALHPKDRAFLRDAGVGKINKSEPGVSFLRRTEYIAERQSAARPDEKGPANTAADDAGDRVDPDSQLRAVEQSFEESQKSLAAYGALRHPRKTKLRAVLVFPLLPDTASMDTTFLAVKFAGSASMARERQAQCSREKARFDEALHADALACAIYKPITSEDGEWVSFYQMKDRQAVRRLRLRLESTEKEQPANLLDGEDAREAAFRFRHHKNYDMLYHPFSKPYEELALRFVSDAPAGGEPAPRKRRAAYYCPISGRVELKKHRASANTEINRFLADSTMDAIDFRLREPNTNELRKMDNARSEYDPMEYEGDDDDDDDDEPEAKEAEAPGGAEGAE
ncbi:hypothetical protein METBIDRAFT_31719 [Metschnikowia bicuspidata var. bicuspidata NRRL YB-4993]|uniref:RNA polymerase II-associated n=1 Tax=Metschnikowia bicuspidata var. bicuspidata NRRL YB-4993 TaxID=869754 RepID=A0A1A0HB57_9ASCO|nr:hypothetical protein METBIDRAFT_31719 [Metschnikowia bicuspidata var. bicuspidata NRRL YB-4993]OBA21112.1 hypothetical protein METBIDRAFT_31719 [Metschnikowia bicuspidata var. bicuspidata NRRL YB-4993]